MAVAVAQHDPSQQREFALSIVQRLREAGHEAYWAGGCVRDSLLGRRPKDYDVATNARPAQIREIFGRRTTLDIGAAFGVVAVVGPKPSGIVEVTTFRHDATYSDGRHPDGVTFTTAEEDAQRRDFTINGLFYDPLAADELRRVIDFVGGVADLERKVVRAIGDPRARFNEDKLRMLRGVRFAATFEFALDEATRQAIAELAPSVTVVSPERIAQEMRALLVLPARAAGMELLRDTTLLAVILPELVPLAATPVEPGGAESGNLWQRTLAVLGQLIEPSFPLALAALLHAAQAAAPPGHHLGSGPTSLVEQLAERWRLSNKETEHAAWLVEHHRALESAETMPWSRLQRLLISSGIHDLLNLHEAISRAAGREAPHVAYCRRRLHEPAEVLDPPPLLTGDDLILHGVPQGKIYKTLLERVRDAQLEREIVSRDEALSLVDGLLNRGDQAIRPRGRMAWTYRADDEAATEMLGVALVGCLPRPAVVALCGTLGAGKTRLVRAMARGLGIDPEVVTSPTFVLVHEYSGETPLFHFDAYRLRGEEEFWQLGPEEYFGGEAPGIAVVEWADRVAGCLPAERLNVSIEVIGPTARRFSIDPRGESYDGVLECLTQLFV